MTKTRKRKQVSRKYTDAPNICKYPLRVCNLILCLKQAHPWEQTEQKLPCKRPPKNLPISPLFLLCALTHTHWHKQCGFLSIYVIWEKNEKEKSGYVPSKQRRLDIRLKNIAPTTTFPQTTQQTPSKYKQQRKTIQCTFYKKMLHPFSYTFNTSFRRQVNLKIAYGYTKPKLK